MPYPNTTVSLPIGDRKTSFVFYRDGLGLEAVGDIAEDGVPEPLQFELTGGCRLMLIPSGGFGWVTGGHPVAPAGTSECILGITAASDAEVDEIVARAGAAGAAIVSAPARQPWGYAGSFADPDHHLWMVTSLPAG